MQNAKIEIFPKVFETGKTHDVFIRVKPYKGQAEKTISVKIQPMERYGIPHTANYRIDEEDRYPYCQAQKVKDGLYKVQYDFFDEQKYDVKAKYGEDVILNTHIYSVFNDLVGVTAFKGDTHLHTNRSDGEGTAFEVGCAYRSAGYDFIAITDHHKYFPLQGEKNEFAELTEEFTVFRGEEVHNRGMGYTHIINFDGDFSVNDIVENEKSFVEKEINEILSSTQFDSQVVDKWDCAYRIFVSNQIRKGNGVSIMAHPFWDCYGEYHVPTKTVEYLIRNGCYDALELLAGNDISGQNGNNLQIALYNDLQAQGAKIALLGASDAHSTRDKSSLFNRQYSFVFAKNRAGIKGSIKERKSVAVLVIDKVNYIIFGEYRWVKYARFLFDEYFSVYQKLTKKHAKALALKEIDKIKRIEKEIQEFKKSFFSW